MSARKLKVQAHPGMEPLYRTAAELPHVRLLLVAKVCACLSVSGEDRTDEVAVALSGSYKLLICMVNPTVIA